MRLLEDIIRLVSLYNIYTAFTNESNDNLSYDSRPPAEHPRVFFALVLEGLVLGLFICWSQVFIWQQGMP